MTHDERDFTKGLVLQVLRRFLLAVFQVDREEFEGDVELVQYHSYPLGTN